MKKIFLITLTAASTQLFASQYLPFILNAIQKNIKPPIKLTYGEITKVLVKNNTMLVLYIKTDKKVTFQKRKTCRLPLFKDIIKENGTIKYILNGKTNGTYVFNKTICKKTKK